MLIGKLFSFVMAGWLLTGAAAGPVPSAPGGRPQHPMRARHLEAGSAPSAPPYKLFLPILAKRYVAGYVSPFGIDMYGSNTNADGQAQMDAVDAGWETVTFHWNSVEPNAPVGPLHTYNWSSFDGIAARAQAAGMNLFVLFTSNPGWAAALEGGPVTPTHVLDLTNIAAAAAERYDGDGVNDAPGHPIVRYWSFYAEPDNNSLPAAQHSGKGYWGDNPNGYGDMIAGVAAAMHLANPNAVVTIGGLAYDSFTTSVPPGHYVQTFLGKVLDRLNTNYGGAAASLGAVAFHYYPINADWPTIKDKAAQIRAVLANHSASSLPLMVPEMGYWSDMVSGTPDWNSTPEKQARILVEMFVQGVSVGIQEMSWFSVFDFMPGTEAHGLFFGSDLTNPKPAYTAYGVMTSELYGGQYAGSISAPSVEGYKFAMGAGGPIKSVVWATGASANLTFFGQSCLRRVDYMGTTTLVHDGDPTWDKDTTAGQITLRLFQDVPLYVGGC